MIFDKQFIIPGAVYISTEGNFPSRRLQQLLFEFEPAKKFNITGDAVFVETLTEIVRIDALELHNDSLTSPVFFFFFKFL